MARTWAQILSEAIEARGATFAAVARDTARLPGGPIQKMTVGRHVHGEIDNPNPKSIRLLCAVLDLDENAVRAEIAQAPVHGDVFKAGEESRTLTVGQRDTVKRVISEMVELNQLLAAHGVNPAVRPDS